MDTNSQRAIMARRNKLQPAHAEHFKMLHYRRKPLVLYNVWDPGSTQIVDRVGSAAIAVHAMSVAAFNGVDIGESLVFRLAESVVSHIGRTVYVPVSVGPGLRFNRQP